MQKEYTCKDVVVLDLMWVHNEKSYLFSFQRKDDLMEKYISWQNLFNREKRENIMNKELFIDLPSTSYPDFMRAGSFGCDA